MSEETIELVRQWFGFLERGELPLELTAEDVVIDNIRDFPMQGPYRGHDGMRQWWSDIAEAFDTFRIAAVEYTPIDGDRVLTDNRASGVYRETGIELDFPWASVITVRDRKIVHAHGYFSHNQARRALEQDG